MMTSCCTQNTVRVLIIDHHVLSFGRRVIKRFSPSILAAITSLKTSADVLRLGPTNSPHPRSEMKRNPERGIGLLCLGSLETIDWISMI